MRVPGIEPTKLYYNCRGCGHIVAVRSVKTELVYFRLCSPCYTKIRQINSDIELGDRVKILAHDDRYYGKTGMVIMKALTGAKTWDLCLRGVDLGDNDLYYDLAEVEKL